MDLFFQEGFILWKCNAIAAPIAGVICPDQQAQLLRSLDRGWLQFWLKPITNTIFIPGVETPGNRSDQAIILAKANSNTFFIPGVETPGSGLFFKWDVVRPDLMKAG
ncbi:MAG: hypothetical protein NTW29_01390 [Bacteroidetes bacterium]|nr:hypothetical protein [Bacteroidota bacterium]